MSNSFRYSLTSIRVALSLLLFEQIAGAQQIQGCDLVSCPLNQYDTEYCPIGNITTNAIGVVNFTTSLSPDPFTWTTATSSSSKYLNSSFSIYERGYYLGLPPNVDLNSANAIGCALFFDEISSSLKFPGDDSDVDIGTCQDAMGSSCVADLQAQTRSIIAGLSTSTNSNSSICAALESALRVKPPGSCSFVQGGNWGEIHARDIQGPTFPVPIELTSCHPTTGTNYSIRLLDTYDLVSEPIFSTLYAFTTGVTPILTALFPQNVTNSSNGPTDFELNLSCVKPVAQQTGPNMIAAGAAGVYSAWSKFSLVFLSAAVVSLGSIF